MLRIFVVLFISVILSVASDSHAICNKIGGITGGHIWVCHKSSSKDVLDSLVNSVAKDKPDSDVSQAIDHWGTVNDDLVMSIKRLNDIGVRDASTPDAAPIVTPSGEIDIQDSVDPRFSDSVIVRVAVKAVQWQELITKIRKATVSHRTGKSPMYLNLKKDTEIHNGYEDTTDLMAVLMKEQPDYANIITDLIDIMSDGQKKPADYEVGWISDLTDNPLFQYLSSLDRADVTKYQATIDMLGDIWGDENENKE